MENPEDLGPFSPHLYLLPIPGSGLPMEWDTWTSVTRDVDLVVNSDYFSSLVRKYRSEIINNEDTLRSVLGSSITNMIRKKDGFSEIVKDLCNQYDIFLGRRALNNFDIDNMLTFIRDFRHIGYDTRVIIPCFLARLHLVTKDDNIEDIRSVILNNTDVLEALYADESMENYAQEISEAIDRIFSI